MITEITNRTCLQVTGEDAKSLLQGLITNDMNLLDNQPAIYACFLTPQGKFLFDFLITNSQDGYLLEVLKDDLEAFQKRLKIYSLRAKADFQIRDDLKIYAGWDNDMPEGAYIDPRLTDLGWRLVTDKVLTTSGTLADYDQHRAKLTVPDGSRDLKPELSTVYDGNLDLLNAVSLKKGCFLGQELTARVHYRGLVKKRLYTVQCDHALTDQDIKTGEGALAGEIFSPYGPYALALIKTAQTENQLVNGQKQLTLIKPAYL